MSNYNLGDKKEGLASVRTQWLGLVDVFRNLRLGEIEMELENLKVGCLPA